MTSKTPSKPKPTSASIGELVGCYNSLLPEYNASVLASNGSKAWQPLEPLDPSAVADDDRDHVIALIRRQNRRLGRTVRGRAIELLKVKVLGDDGALRTDMDNRSIGLMYQEVLDVLRHEFPEASTSAACLRWYVVHMRQEANEEGLRWPDLPQVRPRARSKASVQAQAQVAGI